MTWYALETYPPTTPEGKMSAPTCTTSYEENFTYEIPDFILPHHVATMRRFPFPYAVPVSQPSPASKTEQPIETAGTIETQSAATSDRPLLQQHLMILSEAELRDNPELLKLVDNADPYWRWSSLAVMPTSEFPWGPDTMALPPRLEAQVSAQTSRFNQNGLPWHYYVVTPFGAGFSCCYVGTSLGQLHLHAGEVRTLDQYNSAGEEFPWPSLIRISASDEFRKAKGGALLRVRAVKLEDSCSLQLLTTLCGEWEQSETEPVVDEDLEPEEAGCCGYFSLFHFCSRFIGLNAPFLGSSSL